MEKKVLNFIEENRMLQCGDSVILGVSGGADSLCLLLMLNKVSIEMELGLTVVHVNHHVRGEEADSDQKFVEDFCKKLNVPCVVYHIDMVKLARDNKCSEEEAGRIARYEIFEQVRRQENADKIAVAHNLNDNSETILFNIFRGTGIKGICGIRPVREKVIRPILCLSRAEIEEYLHNNSIKFCVDSTNLQDDYTRNRLRNHVLTYVEENINANAVVNVAKAGNDMSEIEEYLEIETKKVLDKCVKKYENGYLLSDGLLHHHNVIRKRVVRKVIEMLSGRLKDITRCHVETVLGLFEKDTSRQVNIPYGIVARREYEGVSMKVHGTTGTKHDKSQKKNEAVECNESVIYEDGRAYVNDFIQVVLENKENLGENIPDLVYTKWIDCDKIKGALVVRNRQPGDYITIDNSGNTKKIKDYFINEKIPKDKRDDIILVADGSHIVWIVGHRISSEYKITETTTGMLRLSAIIPRVDTLE